MTFGVTDPDTVAWMLERLTPHPWKTFLQIPRTSINCPETLREREEKWRRAFDADNVWHIDAGHNLMLAEPDQVAELLLRLAPEETT